MLLNVIANERDQLRGDLEAAQAVVTVLKQANSGLIARVTELKEANSSLAEASIVPDDMVLMSRKELAEPREADTTVPDQMQNWEGMDGAIAWHLIERHAENWSDIGKMMGEWLAANTPHQPKAEPVQEPAGYFSYDEAKECWREVSEKYRHLGGVDCQPLYATPQQDGLRKAAQMALDLLSAMNTLSFPPVAFPLPGEIDGVMEALRKELGQ
jgi:hypothetical protein